MAAMPAKIPFTAFKYSIIFTAFFAFLAWLLLLGGVSALEQKCNGSCRRLYGLSWFIIWFQFVLVIPAFFVEIFDRSAWRPTLMLLLAINTTLAIVQTNEYLDRRSEGNLARSFSAAPASPLTGYYTLDAYGHNSRINATIAGFIIMSIFNLLLIILSGSRTALEGRYGEDRDVGVATYPAKTRPTTPATTPAPQTATTTVPSQV